MSKHMTTTLNFVPVFHILLASQTLISVHSLWSSIET